MKQRLFALTATVALMGSVTAAETVVDESKFSELEKMNVVLTDPVLTIRGAIEKPDSYILKLEARSANGGQFITAFLDKSSSELYMGTAYDKTGTALGFPFNSDYVKEGVSFSYGTGKKEIYLITDPECPYCARFAKAAEGKLAEYTVHVIFMPLSFHKKAPAMVEWIMMGKDAAEQKSRYDALLLKGSKDYAKNAKQPFVYSAEVKEKMAKAELATMELKVRGTPALYDANFKPLSQDKLLGIDPKSRKAKIRKK